MSLVKNLIIQEEQKAKNKHFSAIKEIEIEPLSDELNAFFQQSILPMLVQFGFDREISPNTFKISGHSWESIKNVPTPQLKQYATFLRDIRKIRNDLVSGQKQKNSETPPSSGRELWNLDNVAESRTASDALIEKLQSIPTPWIILPRAYRFLTDEDSHCLPVYLQRMSKESNLALKKILARILIEYIGNYNLKFISSSLPREQMCDAVFYGYVAMFWKNLQRPPAGLEDMFISRNYLSWAKAYVNREICSDKEKEAALLQMEKTQDDILPDRKTYGSGPGKEVDPVLLHLTLRHGRPGINHAVQYFTLNSTLYRNRGHSPFYRRLPGKTASFFRALRNDYENEDPRTKIFIQTFLLELKNVYNKNTLHPIFSGQNIPDDLIFTHRRMSSMVRDDLSRSIH